MVLTRRSVLRLSNVALGCCLAGCTTSVAPSDNSDTPSPTDESATETKVQTGTPPTECATNYLSVLSTPEEELEGETYEKRLYKALSSQQQEQFEAAMNDGQPPIRDRNKSNWYGTVTYQEKEHRIPLVIEYEGQLYETEVHHADHC